MPKFIIRKDYFKALEDGRKKAEIRLGPYWVKIAQKIQNGEMHPTAVFISGRKRIIKDISKIEIYPTLKKALRNKRWRILGLNAQTYKSAINEILKMYKGKKIRPAVIFWLKNG